MELHRPHAEREPRASAGDQPQAQVAGVAQRPGWLARLDLAWFSRPGPRLIVLAALAAGLIALFLTIGVTDWGFALPRRARKVAAMLLVGGAITYSTVLFQTVTNNRILTPSIIGFDSLYLLVQTLVVFLFGAGTLLTLDPRLQFALNAGCMVLFAGLLYRWLFEREGRNLYFLVLVGVILGTLFGNISSFLQRLIDPNEFAVLQDRMFASFNSVDEDLLGIAALGVLLALLYSLRFARSLDVIALGRDHAINLGVDHRLEVRRVMVVVAVLVAIATALVGPITFFGLLTANLAHQLMGSYRHRLIVPAAALLSVIALAGGQLLVERVFSFNTSLSVIINFIGGIYFIYLLLREARS